MFDLVRHKAEHRAIKWALCPASLSFRTSVCLLTFNISLSWVVLTLAWALKVSLSRRDMPVCFGLYFATVSTDSISPLHAVSGLRRDNQSWTTSKPGCCSHLPHQRRSHDLRLLRLIGAPRLSHWILRWLKFSLIDVAHRKFLFVLILATQRALSCGAAALQFSGITRQSNSVGGTDVLLFRISVDEFLWAASIYSSHETAVFCWRVFPGKHKQSCKCKGSISLTDLVIQLLTQWRMVTK